MGMLRGIGQAINITDVIESGEPLGAVMYHSSQVNFNSKSTVVCRPGEQAVFVSNGTIQQVIGGGSVRVQTSLHPILKSFHALVTSGKDSYTSDVYFVRTTLNTPIRWGTKITCQDPVYKIMSEMGASGTYTYRVYDAGLFMTEMFGTGRQQITTEDINRYLRDLVNMEISSAIVEAVVSSGTDLLNIQMHLPKVAEIVRAKVDANARTKGIAIIDLAVSQMSFVDSAVRDKLEMMKLHSMNGGAYNDVSKWNAVQTFVENPSIGNAMPGMIMGAMMNNGQGGIGGALFGNQPNPSVGTAQSSQGSIPVSNGPRSQSGSSASASKRFCQDCGTKLDPGARFCPNCGARQ